MWEYDSNLKKLYHFYKKDTFQIEKFKNELTKIIEEDDIVWKKEEINDNAVIVIDDCNSVINKIIDRKMKNKNKKNFSMFKTNEEQENLIKNENIDHNQMPDTEYDIHKNAHLPLSTRIECKCKKALKYEQIADYHLLIGRNQ